MKIAVIACARNEATVIEAFVRHHASIADSVTIIVHRNQDSTEDILRSLVAEGLPLRIRKNEGHLHDQSERMTAEARILTAKEKPDWILPLDADEFLVATDGREVRTVLASMRTDACLSVPWRGYVPLPTDHEAEPNVLKRVQHRRAHELPAWTKILVPRNLIHEDFRLSPGNHSALRGTEPIAEHTDHPLALAHFPVRTQKQIMAKVLAGWLNHSADPNRVTNSDFQWKSLYDHLLTGEDPTPEDLKRFALEYATRAQWISMSEEFRKAAEYSVTPTVMESSDAVVYDPVPCAFDLRYHIREADPLRVIMEEAQLLSDAHVKLLREQRGHQA